MTIFVEDYEGPSCPFARRVFRILVATSWLAPLPAAERRRGIRKER